MADNQSGETIALNVNGRVHQVQASTDQTLLETLRESLQLTGVRGACGIGMCGACTVLVDGRPLSSCLLLPNQVEGREILTIEGLAPDGQLHPVQQAFIDQAGFQCAYCTPGFILTTVALLDRDPDPNDDVIRRYLSGNLCRCGSYGNILEAVQVCRSEERPSVDP